MVDQHRPISDQERLARLRLARSRGIGATQIRRLLERYGTAQKALRRLTGGHTALGSQVRLAREDEVTREYETLRAAGAVLLVPGEPDYPELLTRLDDAPPVLTVMGDPQLLKAPSLAVVGARNASGSGRILATRLAEQAASSGLTIVSGLARGIDTAAHFGGIDQPASTVAVLGNGVDIAYPPDNAALQTRIAAEGALVSERPWGSPPLARHFPGRNRIVAGLAAGVLVIEAAQRSGSLMTARLAAEQGREVMAVPGSPLDPRHAGTNALIREGAVLVETIEDVLRCLAPLSTTREPRQARPPGSAPQAPAFSTAPRSAPGERTAPLLPAGIDRDLIERLGHEPLAIDELIRQMTAEPTDIHRVLVDLELEGRVIRHPGNRISVSPG